MCINLILPLLQGIYRRNMRIRKYRMERKHLCIRNTTTYKHNYPDFVTYPYKFQKQLLLLLGKKCFLFAGFYGILPSGRADPSWFLYPRP